MAQNAVTQAQQLRTPEPVTAMTPINPLQQDAYNLTRHAYDVTGGAYGRADEAYGRAALYENEVTAGTAAETRRELERARDEMSVGMQSEGEAAMSRGADPTLFRSRSMDTSRRGIHELQGRLAGESLRARQGAVDSRTNAAGGVVSAANSRVNAAGVAAGAASSAANTQSQMHLGTMAQRLAENRALVEQAEAQARINEMPYTRLANLMESSARNASAYSGGRFTSGGGAWASG